MNPLNLYIMVKQSFVHVVLISRYVNSNVDEPYFTALTNQVPSDNCQY